MVALADQQCAHGHFLERDDTLADIAGAGEAEDAVPGVGRRHGLGDPDIEIGMPGRPEFECPVSGAQLGTVGAIGSVR